MRRLAVLLVASLILVSCGGDDVSENVIEDAIENQDDIGDVEVDVDSDSGEAEIVIEGNDGDQQVSIGGGDLPDDFPWDLPGGGEINAVSTSPSGNLVAVYYPAGDFDKLVDTFEQIALDESDVFSSFSTSEPPSASWSWDTPDGGLRSITVTGTGDQVYVQFIWGAG